MLTFTTQHRNSGWVMTYLCDLTYLFKTTVLSKWGREKEESLAKCTPCHPDVSEICVLCIIIICLSETHRSLHSASAKEAQLTRAY